MLYLVMRFASVLQLFTLQFYFAFWKPREQSFPNVNVHTIHLGALLKCRVLSQGVWGRLRSYSSKEVSDGPNSATLDTAPRVLRSFNTRNKRTVRILANTSENQFGYGGGVSLADLGLLLPSPLHFPYSCKYLLSFLIREKPGEQIQKPRWDRICGYHGMFLQVFWGGETKGYCMQPGVS
jgi:hypothetical protein